jgi:hypothetical protein
MADGGLLMIFRGMTTEQLLDLRDSLIEQWIALGPYAAQTVGTKSFTKDSRNLQAQLEALQFVLNERGAAGGIGYSRYFIYDFSLSQPDGQPAGVTDQLSY